MIDRIRFYPEPEDPFASTRMSLGEHIEELRRCLWRALLGFGVALIAGFALGAPLLEFLTAPVARALTRFHRQRLERTLARLRDNDPKLVQANAPMTMPILIERRRLLEILGQSDSNPAAPDQVPLIIGVRPLDAAPLVERVQELTRPPLRTFGVVEPCLSYLQVSLYSGAVLASPWMLYQLWVFIAAGLYPQEKRRVYLYLPLSLGLFLAGVCLCEFVVLPTGLEYLLSFNEWLGFEPELRLSEWLGFATLMPLVFGCSFQTPLVMIALNRIGLVSVDTYRRQRRLAFFLLAVLAAILTVTPDWYNMLALTVPLCALYELGIVLCRLGPAPAPDCDELVHDPFAEV